MLREDVRELELELRHHRFEFFEGDVMFAPLKAVKGHDSHPSLLGEFGVRHVSSGFAEVFGELGVEALFHP